MKRRIGEPKVPKGPQYTFFNLMQRHVLEQGDKSLAALSKESGWSRQTWHKALRGPELPNRDLVRALVEHLFPGEGSAEVRRRRVEETLAAWTAAVAERTFGERTAQWDSPPAASAAVPLAADVPEPSATAEASEREVRSTGALADLPREQWPYDFRWNHAKQRQNLPEEARFFQLLHQYYIGAGRPTLRWIAERIPQEARVTRSTLNEWLNGTTLPADGRRLRAALNVMRSFAPVTAHEREMDADAQDVIRAALMDAWGARTRPSVDVRQASSDVRSAGTR
ncbi:hypothetical protein JQK87_11920 [Streptomyces sp. G44]|uniref:hypothetical protein n=1 Tax=Streptomyces sp. G44 TaxID=2807632 RepID=UPI00195F7A72|nr:hypothetical protein [Streptomyces sp. G44]MBM7169110.1 hypothetical protein [Streptomyces sp. G44]